MSSSAGRGLTVALTAVALAIPWNAPSAALAEPSATASASAPIPCPKAAAPKTSRPPRPSPPAANPTQQALGGEQLASAGLVVPSGMASPPANTAISWLVADLDTGEVLGACGAHEYGTPASVQKLLLTATYLDKLDPKQVATVTHDDLAQVPSDSSLVGLVENGKYSVETLWLGLLLQSGNDAATVLARLGGGTVAAGVQGMNEEAEKLGAFQTHAVTPSGYDGVGQFTSAYDLALIARVCFDNETFRKYALTQRTQIPAQPPKYKGFQIQNENQLIFDYPGALGGKTGFTSLARHTYVGAAERNGRRLVVTLMGAEPRPQRGWQQGAALLDWGFSLPTGASVGHLVTPEEAHPAPSPSVSPSGALLAEAASGSLWAPVPVAAGVAVAAGLSVLIGLFRVRRRRRSA
ncbi:MAG: D-alanyl-D-alanine carboxypeptidase [Hamadaea sp.]|uniref:D-alanyl-D-alanine carboxypeptidase family protein n=1 Tax=Hamadaea sp. TaxID=2024425 RepID=UPI0017A3F3A6|nr:serine hydrolase [Hamadaea sp.]NUR70453.1 D-alanyl-D-alanine carboxypeptidase [Hamadaea sp.]NUT20043.1 D-alanyl-D-alanine carboxypeptidase [Hamadaea sp.]